MYKKEHIKPIIETAINNSFSMKEAASKINMHFNTFKKYAIEFNLYKPNQSGKGISKKKSAIPLSEILKGNYPQYQTYKLAKRLLKENIKIHQCEICKRTKWNNQLIPLELDHIDGNPYNHIFSNLRFLCPNCHSFTPTHRGKNKRN